MDEIPRLDLDTRVIHEALVRHRKGYGETSIEQAYKIAAEEMGELITAMNHHRRGRINIEKLLEEVADVLLSCRVIAYLFQDEKFVTEMVEMKAARFEPGRGGLGQQIKLSDVVKWADMEAE